MKTAAYVGSYAPVKKRRVKKRVKEKTALVKVNHFNVLIDLIKEHIEASIAEASKGGGDPYDMPLLEKELELSCLKLTTHIEKMRRDYEGGD